MEELPPLKPPDRKKDTSPNETERFSVVSKQQHPGWQRHTLNEFPKSKQASQHGDQDSPMLEAFPHLPPSKALLGNTPPPKVAWTGDTRQRLGYFQPELPKEFYVGDGEDGEDGAALDVNLEAQAEGLSFPPEEICPWIKCTNEEFNRYSCPWRGALVIKVLGKSVGFMNLRPRIRSLWQLKEEVVPVDVGNGFYVVRFGNKEDYEKVLNEGPWIVMGHYLTVQKWSPAFDADEAQVKSTRVWVRIPGVPLPLFDREYVEKMGKALGQGVRVDPLTSEAIRGQYVRINVEIDLQKPLISQLRVGNKVVNVEYEGLHQICFSCGAYGHSAVTCPGKGGVVLGHQGDITGKAIVQGDMASNSAGVVRSLGRTEDIFGAWMVPRRPQRFSPNFPGRNSSPPTYWREKGVSIVEPSKINNNHSGLLSTEQGPVGEPQYQEVKEAEIRKAKGKQVGEEQEFSGSRNELKGSRFSPLGDETGDANIQQAEEATPKEGVMGSRFAVLVQEEDQSQLQEKQTSQNKSGIEQSVLDQPLNPSAVVFGNVTIERPSSSSETEQEDEDSDEDNILSSDEAHQTCLSRHRKERRRRQKSWIVCT